MAGSANLRTNMPPMPRSSGDAPAGSTAPQSASTAPMSVKTSPENGAPAPASTSTSTEATPQAAAAMPFAGGFAAAPLVGDTASRTVEPAVPGAMAAADYMVEGDFGTQRTAPPVIGG
jgi:hypothetical protein